ncbi:hypothetical protein [Bacillus sp. LL01]|nr:hypothetical protein [Bacillus sp. LL01]
MDALLYLKQPTDTADYVHLAHEEAPLDYWNFQQNRKKAICTHS